MEIYFEFCLLVVKLGVCYTKGDVMSQVSSLSLFLVQFLRTLVLSLWTRCALSLFPLLAVSGDVRLRFFVVLCYADGRSDEGGGAARWGMIGHKGIPEGSRALGQRRSHMAEALEQQRDEI